MAANEFVAVNWTARQLIDEDAMDQINSNLVYLKNAMTTGAYTGSNTEVRVDQGLKMVCGRKLIATGESEDTANVRVGFPSNLFSAGTSPIVTTSLACPAGVTGLTSVIYGPDGNDHPTHQGFRIKLHAAPTGDAKKANLKKAVYVNWIAMGY